MLAHPGLDVRFEHAERGEVAVVLGRVLRGDLRRGDALLLRADDDLVVDVRDVADVGHLVAEKAQRAHDDVGREGRPRVPDVAHVVHRRPAAVDADLAGLQGLEDDLAAAQGVEELDDGQAHGVRPRWAQG